MLSRHILKITRSFLGFNQIRMMSSASPISLRCQQMWSDSIKTYQKKGNEQNLIQSMQDSYLNKQQVTLFTTNTRDSQIASQKCVSMLQKYNIEHTIVNFEDQIEQDYLRLALSMHTGYLSLPNVYFGSKHIGGYDDLYSYFSCQ